MDLGSASLLDVYLPLCIPGSRSWRWGPWTRLKPRTDGFSRYPTFAHMYVIDMPCAIPEPMIFAQEFHIATNLLGSFYRSFPPLLTILIKKKTKIIYFE